MDPFPFSATPSYQVFRRFYVNALSFLCEFLTPLQPKSMNATKFPVEKFGLQIFRLEFRISNFEFRVQGF